ncbi:MAG: hypothetical protein KUG74_00920 [Rhodobacteraceae bacterium]|nr:hypothetical protein [Paracoccaceae bacterium]
MYKRIATAALIFGMVATAPPALAQSNCAPRDKVISQLADKYGEVSHGVGLQSASKLVEVWSSKTTGSWSIVVTHANGLTCVLAAGQVWTPNPAFAFAGDPEA